MTTPPPADQADTSPRQLKELACTIAMEAAQLVVERRLAIASIDTKSTLTDLVTDVDQASEALIVDFIARHRPDDAIVGEEGASVAGSSGYRWIIDPIDGTTSFVYGYPGFTVSIAVAYGDRVIAGAVADPTGTISVGRDVDLNAIDVFSASLDGGAFCNAEPIHVREADRLANALVATGFSFDPERRRRQAQVLTRVLPVIRDIRRSGSAAMDLLRVAAGQVDAYYEVGLHEWDRAAAAHIAAEAGAVTQTNESPLTVAAAPGIAQPLMDLLAETDAASV